MKGSHSVVFGELEKNFEVSYKLQKGSISGGKGKVAIK
jgi:hypothetical protein